MSILDQFWSVATTAGQVLGWWCLISVGTFAVIYPIIRMARDEPEPAPKPVLVWVNEHKAEER